MYEAEFVLPAAPSLAPPPVTPKSEPEPLGSQDTEDDPSGSPEAKAGVQEQPLANPTAQVRAFWRNHYADNCLTSLLYGTRVAPWLPQHRCLPRGACRCCCPQLSLFFPAVQRL